MVSLAAPHGLIIYKGVLVNSFEFLFYILELTVLQHCHCDSKCYCTAVGPTYCLQTVSLRIQSNSPQSNP